MLREMLYQDFKLNSNRDVSEKLVHAMASYTYKKVVAHYINQLKN